MKFEIEFLWLYIKLFIISALIRAEIFLKLQTLYIIRLMQSSFNYNSQVLFSNNFYVQFPNLPKNFIKFLSSKFIHANLISFP